jgi:hypothetical protein
MFLKNSQILEMAIIQKKVQLMNFACELKEVMILGGTGNPIGNSLWRIRWQPKSAPEVSSLNRAWNREQTELAQKPARVAGLGLVPWPVETEKSRFSFRFNFRSYWKLDRSPKFLPKLPLLKRLKTLYDLGDETGGKKCLVSKDPNPQVH